MRESYCGGTTCPFGACQTVVAKSVHGSSASGWATTVGTQGQWEAQVAAQSQEHGLGQKRAGRLTGYGNYQPVTGGACKRAATGDVDGCPLGLQSKRV